MGCVNGITAPQFEQNRALWGNPVPQRVQKTAMIDPSPRKPNHSEDTRTRRPRFRFVEGDGLYRLRKNSVLYQGTTSVVP
jgi:hypothetical protein